MAQPTLTRQYRRSWLRWLVLPAVSGSMLFYFAVHVQSGRYGLEAKAKLQQSLADAQSRYASLRDARERLERRVNLLRDGTLDRDLIEERARRALDYVAADEVVVIP